MAKMGVKNCYVRLPLVLFLLIKLLVLNFLCSALYQTFFQGRQKKIFSLNSEEKEDLSEEWKN